MSAARPSWIDASSAKPRALSGAPAEHVGPPDRPRIVTVAQARAKGAEVLDRWDYRMLEPGEAAGVIGVSQNGKSTWCFGWAAAMVAQGVDTLAWDPCHEWGVDARKRRRARPGPLARTVTVSELQKNPRMLLENRLNLAVRPDNIHASKREISEQFKAFIYMVRSLCTLPVALFIDEISKLRKYAEEELDDLAECAGKDDLLPVFIAQRWSHFTANMRAEIAWLISFLQVKESDLRFIREDAGSDFARRVCLLEPYQYVATNLRRAHMDVLRMVGALPALPSPSSTPT
jgi:hypothetical protein